jgi:hypothetical protein
VSEWVRARGDPGCPPGPTDSHTHKPIPSHVTTILCAFMVCPPYPQCMPSVCAHVVPLQVDMLLHMLDGRMGSTASRPLALPSSVLFDEDYASKNFGGKVSITDGGRVFEVRKE